MSIPLTIDSKYAIIKHIKREEALMFLIDFYETADGFSDIRVFYELE